VFTPQWRAPGVDGHTMASMSKMENRFTRRSAIRAGAGSALALAAAANGLPAWARPIANIAQAPGPGTLPFPNLPEGTPTMAKIEHIIVLMMENHTFDNFLGMLPNQVKTRSKVDGLKVDKHGKATNFNLSSSGKPIRATRMPSPCQADGVGQNWLASHTSFNGGKNNGFVRASSAQAMQYFDQTDLPFSYSLATHFPIGERYFSSVLAQTYPNRRFLFAGTANGNIATNNTTFSIPAPAGTIFDRLDAHQISWKSYYESLPSALIIPGVGSGNRGTMNFRPITEFFTDCAAGTLPSVTYLDPQYETQSEENPQDIQIGEHFMAHVVNSVMSSPNWSKTALIINYDEGGGYYDHVPPPKTVTPDDTPPILGPGDPPGAYDRYGFRVPLYVISPWARKNYVSRVVQDHTSVLKFIERKFNLGAITRRDAAAADMTDYFDFNHAAFMTPPKLAKPPLISKGLKECTAEGLKPPLPNDGNKNDVTPVL
jgi:phospholipase C